jgi:hypothetical protein
MRSAGRLAIPVAMFAPPAMVRRSVTLYGIVDHGVTRTVRRRGAPRWQDPFSPIADSFLPRHTDTDAMALCQHAAGDATHAQITRPDASDMPNRRARRAGLRHTF